METVRDKSDDEYSTIGDKGDIGFIDVDKCNSVCDYYPSEESGEFIISVPFPLVKGKPQSGIVGETMYERITIKNTTDISLYLSSVSIYDSKPENSFTISLMEPPSVNSDEQYIQDFMESFSLEDRVLRGHQEFSIWLSCKPKEIGLHSAGVHITIDNNEDGTQDTIERLVFVLAEDKVSQSLTSTKPYYRAMKKKQNVVDVHAADQAFVAGRRPSKGAIRSYKYRLPIYPIPAHIQEVVKNCQIPNEVNMDLTRANYVPFFKTLLAMEEIKMEEDMRAYDMDRVTMKTKSKRFLSLEVPGLAEKRPSLVNGDNIFVRRASGDGTANFAYQGYIHRVEAEEIFLCFDPKFHNCHRDSHLYNVQFTYNRTGMRRLYQAVEAAGFLDKNILFPSPSNTRLVKSSPLVPILGKLNEEQTRAIEMILACRGGSPYVIHGPPGTGKTMTLIESILQIYCSRKRAKILVCAPSNNAADHVLDRLIVEGSAKITTSDVFRLNAFTRPFEDVNPNYIDYCYVEDFIFTCPSQRELEQFRIIISTYTSASLLYAEGIRRGHFSHIFLDEAGHASEPDTMVPISHLCSDKTTVVLAGDPMQLGPVVFSKDAELHGLGTTYLDRLFKCELYANGDENFMTKLVRNYRTHPAILQLPSELFYDGLLMPTKEENSCFTTSMDDLLPNTDFPLLFIGIQGCDEREGSNPSWFNRIEASKVVEIVKILIELKGLKEEDVGVITPYRQQALKIRGALESLGRSNIKVGSVEQFQGQENQVIIISTVRSTIKHEDFDRVHSLGFLGNSRRFNVALTRAKSLLIVIGNPHILCQDPYWNKLLWYCVDNGGYKGCFLPKKEEYSAEAPPGTEEDGNWQCEEVNNWQLDEVNNWQQEEVNNWQQGNNWQSEEGGTGWQQGNNWQQEEVNGCQQGNNWQSEEGGNNWQQGNNWQSEEGGNGWQQPSDVQWNKEGNNYHQPLDAPWGDEDEGDNWNPSEVQPGVESNGIQGSGNVSCRDAET